MFAAWERTCYYEAMQRFFLAACILLPFCLAGRGAGQEQDKTVVESPQWQEASSAEEDAPAPGKVPEPSPKPQQEADPIPALDPAPVPESGEMTQADPTRQETKAAEKAMQEPDQHVVSQSRMFSVSGGDSLRMGAIATKADEVRGSVCRLLGFSTEWKYAISIRLIGQPTDPPEPNPIRTRISIIGQEPNFQIRIFPGGGINVERLTNAIIMMSLYERALREMRADSLPDAVNMPEWLVTGVQQAILWRSGKADRRLYQNLFNRAEMLSPEEIVSTENAARLDASSRQVYEVSCGVLVMCLANREGGLAQLRELVEEAATEEGTPKDIISAHFHELGVDGNMLDKWWALELAALSQPLATEALTPMETEKRLAEALTVLYYNPTTRTPEPVSVDNLYALVELPDWREQMRPCVDRLMELNLRCFPGYHAILTEYARAIAELLKGASPDEVQNIVGPLRDLRQAYVKTSIRGRDYLDWYEITQLGNTQDSGSFNSYLDAMRVLRKESPGPQTPLGAYLDDIESLHSLGEGEELPPRLKMCLKSREGGKKDEKKTSH